VILSHTILVKIGGLHIAFTHPALCCYVSRLRPLQALLHIKQDAHPSLPVETTVRLIIRPAICLPSNRHSRCSNAFLSHDLSATHELLWLTWAGRDTETNTFIAIQSLLLKAFLPFKPLTPPPAAALINSTSAEFSILLRLAKQGKPPRRFSLAEYQAPRPPLLLAWGGQGQALPGGLSFPQCPVCRITSALRNSALLIEKGKICTTCSSLQETGGVIRDAEIL